MESTKEKSYETLQAWVNGNQKTKDVNWVAVNYPINEEPQLKRHTFTVMLYWLMNIQQKSLLDVAEQMFKATTEQVPFVVTDYASGSTYCIVPRYVKTEKEDKPLETDSLSRVPRNGWQREEAPDYGETITEQINIEHALSYVSDMLNITRKEAISRLAHFYATGLSVTGFVRSRKTGYYGSSKDTYVRISPPRDYSNVLHTYIDEKLDLSYGRKVECVYKELEEESKKVNSSEWFYLLQRNHPTITCLHKNWLVQSKNGCEVEIAPDLVFKMLKDIEKLNGVHAAAAMLNVYRTQLPISINKKDAPITLTPPKFWYNPEIKAEDPQEKSWGIVSGWTNQYQRITKGEACRFMVKAGNQTEENVQLDLDGRRIPFVLLNSDVLIPPGYKFEGNIYNCKFCQRNFTLAFRSTVPDWNVAFCCKAHEEAYLCHHPEDDSSNNQNEKNDEEEKTKETKTWRLIGPTGNIFLCNFDDACLLLCKDKNISTDGAKSLLKLYTANRLKSGNVLISPKYEIQSDVYKCRQCGVLYTFAFCKRPEDYETMKYCCKEHQMDYEAKPNPAETDEIVKESGWRIINEKGRLTQTTYDAACQEVEKHQNVSKENAAIILQRKTPLLLNSGNVLIPPFFNIEPYMWICKRCGASYTFAFRSKPIDFDAANYCCKGHEMNDKTLPKTTVNEETDWLIVDEIGRVKKTHRDHVKDFICLSSDVSEEEALLKMESGSSFSVRNGHTVIPPNCEIANNVKVCQLCGMLYTFDFFKEPLNFDTKKYCCKMHEAVAESEIKVKIKKADSDPEPAGPQQDSTVAELEAKREKNKKTVQMFSTIMLMASKHGWELDIASIGDMRFKLSVFEIVAILEHGMNMDELTLPKG